VYRGQASLWWSRHSGIDLARLRYLFPAQPTGQRQSTGEVCLFGELARGGPGEPRQLERTFLYSSPAGPTVRGVDNDKERGRPSVHAETLTREMDETDESSFVTELVRQAISQRADESMRPLGCLDPQTLDRVLAKYARRRKDVQIAVAITLGLVLALTAGVALLRAGSGRLSTNISLSRADNTGPAGGRPFVEGSVRLASVETTVRRSAAEDGAIEQHLPEGGAGEGRGDLRDDPDVAAHGRNQRRALGGIKWRRGVGDRSLYRGHERR